MTIGPFIRAAETAVAGQNSAGRLVSYLFCTTAVGRDFHTVATTGWRLENFLKNPVFQFAHDTRSLPIGKVVDISISGDKLLGTVQYTTEEENAFGDTCYRLVQGGFLNAVSVAWNPLKWTYSKDPARPGGIDFLEQELLEVSQVPVPALASALVTARGAGIDVKPIETWAARKLNTSLPPGTSRPQMEALYRAARQPATVDMRSLIKLDTTADRRKYLRFAIYEQAKRGLPVPRSMLPPETREERAAIARGALIMARRP